MSVLAGTTILIDDSSGFGGATTIAKDATLQIGNGGTDGAIGGTIANSGTLAFDRSDSSTFKGAISGSGAVDVLSGVLTLTRDSGTFAGTTTIAGGATLQIGSGGTSGALGGAIAAKGTLAYNRTDASNLSGVISGAGSFEVLSGTLGLTGDSSGFAGKTTVSGGATLQIGSGGTSGALGGAIAANGTLTYNRTDASTLTGAISGAGTLNVLGGTAVQTGESSGFTGTTTVSNGAALQIGDGGTSGALGGAITAQGTLA